MLNTSLNSDWGVALENIGTVVSGQQPPTTGIWTTLLGKQTVSDTSIAAIISCWYIGETICPEVFKPIFSYNWKRKQFFYYFIYVGCNMHH